MNSFFRHARAIFGLEEQKPENKISPTEEFEDFGVGGADCYFPQGMLDMIKSGEISEPVTASN